LAADEDTKTVFHEAFMERPLLIQRVWRPLRSTSARAQLFAERVPKQIADLSPEPEPIEPAQRASALPSACVVQRAVYSARGWALARMRRLEVG